MSLAAALRTQIEATLADRIPGALTPMPRLTQPVMASGIHGLDELLHGGLPLGAVTEITGPECSGRTSVALACIAQITRTSRVCAWIDVSDNLHPESAAAAGVDLARLLWVRCGVSDYVNVRTLSQTGLALQEKHLTPPPIKKGLHGGGFGPHPRSEIRGLSSAVSDLLNPQKMPAKVTVQVKAAYESKRPAVGSSQRVSSSQPIPVRTMWSGMDDALRVTDLLLQGGGFSAIVLDMSGVAPEYALRVPLATWFRFRAAAERTQAAILLLTQQPCAKSSAGLVLRLHAGTALEDGMTVFAGIRHQAEVVRQRFPPAPSKVVPLRKPPQRETTASWHNRTAWVGQR